MRSSLLRLLACPFCRGPFELVSFRGDADGVVEEGVLRCRCSAAFPVMEGVPRIVEGALEAAGTFRNAWSRELEAIGVLRGRALDPPSDAFRKLVEPTLKRFGKEWKEHSLVEHTWGLDQATRLEHARRYLGWPAEEARGRTVLDAGCGTAKLTCGMATWGAEAVGVDLQPSCVRGWRARRTLAGEHADRVHVVQGDLMRPPFRPESFDGVHSAGVLHHTPDTREAFRTVARLVKPGGSLGVWLYRKDREDAGRVPWFPFARGRWASIAVSRLRRVTPRLPPTLLHGLLLAYAAVFHTLYASAAAIRGRRHGQTIRERTTSLFDTLAPPFVWRHTVEEVTVWFLDAGFADVRDTTVPGDEDGFCLTGRRA